MGFKGKSSEADLQHNSKEPGVLRLDASHSKIQEQCVRTPSTSPQIRASAAPLPRWEPSLGATHASNGKQCAVMTGKQTGRPALHNPALRPNHPICADGELLIDGSRVWDPRGMDRPPSPESCLNLLSAQTVYLVAPFTPRPVYRITHAE